MNLLQRKKLNDMKANFKYNLGTALGVVASPVIIPIGTFVIKMERKQEIKKHKKAETLTNEMMVQRIAKATAKRMTSYSAWDSVDVMIADYVDNDYWSDQDITHLLKSLFGSDSVERLWYYEYMTDNLETKRELTELFAIEMEKLGAKVEWEVETNYSEDTTGYEKTLKISI